MKCIFVVVVLRGCNIVPMSNMTALHHFHPFIATNYNTRFNTFYEREAEAAHCEARTNFDQGKERNHFAVLS